MFNFIQTYLFEISISLLGIVVFTQLLYYLCIFLRFAHHTKTDNGNPTKYPVSIVISAKGVAHHLIKTLPLFLEQDYPEYEVIVVNDNSDDETVQVINDFQIMYPHLKLVDLSSSITYIKGKKFPLSIGIKSAAYEHILLTEPNCYPASNQWVAKMAQHFSDKVFVVLGFSTYYKKKGILNAIIHYDVFHTALQYFSYFLAKKPFMGIGENLAYTKSIFFNNNGFVEYNHLAFGEDDLFVNKVVTAENCSIEYSPESHIYSRPFSNFRTWMFMKSVRCNTKKLYKHKHRFLLNLYSWSITLAYIFLSLAIILSIHNPKGLMIIAGIMFTKYLTQYLIMGFSAAKLEEKRITPFLILFDIFFAIFNPIIYIVSIFSKKE